MAKLPPPVKNLGGIVKGFNELRAFAASIKPQAGINTTINESETGTVISADAQALSGDSPRHYSFEMRDASDSDGAHVLIFDGQVFGPAEGVDEGAIPDGMGDDNYQLDVSGDDTEIWVEIDWSDDDGTIASCSINSGESTPDSTEFTSYIRIGNVAVDNSGAVPKVSDIDNTQCGDIVIDLPNVPDDAGDGDPPVRYVLGTDTDGGITWIQTTDCDS